jgi:membrane protease YdiL (CAAX protease family)
VAVGAIALVAGVGLYLLAGGPQTVSPSTQTGQIVTSLGLAGRIHLDVNAAVVEELFFRGLLIERLITITGRTWLAGVISYVAFVGGHIPGSGLTLALTGDAVGALALVLLYLLRRNVAVCMVAHAVMDVTVVLA